MSIQRPISIQDPTPIQNNDLQRLTTPTLRERIGELSAQLHAATFELLMLVAELDRRKAWGEDGILSCAHWLSWQCGIGMNAAREKVRVARALESLPSICEAFARGQLSYCKVRALTRVANTQIEDELLERARYATGAQVERLVRGVRYCFRNGEGLDENERSRRQHDERGVFVSYPDDGTVLISARLPAETGARVVNALRALGEQLKQHDAEPRANPAQQRADALVMLADGYLEGSNANDEDHDQNQDAVPSRTTNGAHNRYEVIVHVDAEVLAQVQQPGQCRIEDGPGIAAHVARRLCCDGSTVAMTVDAQGDPLDVGRKSRVVPTGLRRALHRRDGGCRFPGCTHTHRLHAHHIRHWANGGETKLSNLVELCHYHHRLVHEGGFGVRACDDGAIQFTRPDGSGIAPIPSVFEDDDYDNSAGDMLRARSSIQGLEVTAETSKPLGGGEPLNLDWTLACLMPAIDRRLEAMEAKKH